MAALWASWLSGDDMEQFAARLRQALEVRKMTQARLSELLEVDHRVYNRWERGAALPQIDSAHRPGAAGKHGCVGEPGGATGA